LSRKTKKNSSVPISSGEPCSGYDDRAFAGAVTLLTVEDLVKTPIFKARALTGRRGLRGAVRSHRPFLIRLPLTGRPRRGEGRVHCLGRKALAYLAALPVRRQRQLAERICRVDAAAVVIAPVPDPPGALLAAARERDLPVLASALPQTRWAAALKDLFEERTCPKASAHGVLMEVSGVGMLILGPSGIGKSESALDLVTRGHRLIADDLIIIRRGAGGRLLGRGSKHAGSHMEIRGLGIINIQDLFGVAAVLEKKEIELVVDLRDWDTLSHCDRLGLEDSYHELLGVKLPYLRIPVTHGRNMAVILEVAARNHLLKKQGCHTAQDFEEALAGRLAREGVPETEGGGDEG